MNMDKGAWDKLMGAISGGKSDAESASGPSSKVHGWDAWMRDTKKVVDFFHKALVDAARAGGDEKAAEAVEDLVSQEAPPEIQIALSRLCQAVATTEGMYWASYITGAANMAMMTANEAGLDREALERGLLISGALASCARDAALHAEERNPGTKAMSRALANAVDPSGKMMEKVKEGVGELLEKAKKLKEEADGGGS